MDLSEFIAFASFVLSFTVVVWQYFTYKELEKQKRILNEQQELLNKYNIKRIEQEESNYRKADIRIWIEHIKSSDFYICIGNKGSASARNIRVDWRGIDKATENNNMYINEQGKLPCMLLNPEEYIKLLAVTFLNLRNRTPLVLISWEDDFSKDNKKEFMLSF